jgi:hypothetical protein
VRVSTSGGVGSGRLPCRERVAADERVAEGEAAADVPGRGVEDVPVGAGGQLVGLGRLPGEAQHLLQGDHVGVEAGQAGAQERQPLGPRALAVPDVQGRDPEAFHRGRG